MFLHRLTRFLEWINVDENENKNGLANLSQSAVVSE